VCWKSSNARSDQRSFLPEGKTQKDAHLDRCHLALLLVDLKLKPLGKIPRQARLHPLASPQTPDQYQNIVGVAREAVPSSFQFPIQIVQQDVGQQRREHAMDAKDNSDRIARLSGIRAGQMSRRCPRLIAWQLGSNGEW
jgi:hypothetical protein